MFTVQHNVGRTMTNVRKEKVHSRMGKMRVSAVSKNGGQDREDKKNMKEVVRKAMDESLQNVFDTCDYNDESDAKGKASNECIVAWDEYWELEHAYFTKWEEWAKDAKDPLMSFCEKYPWSMECKEYEV